MGVAVMHPEFRISRMKSHERTRFTSPEEQFLEFELPTAVLCGARETTYDNIDILVQHTQPRMCNTEESIVENVKPWVSELLHDEQLGGGCVEIVSETVLLTKKLVLKATSALEVSILLHLHEVCPHIVPRPYATYQSSTVYRKVPSGCDTALLYHKVEGVICSQLLEELSAAYRDTQHEIYLTQIKQVINGSLSASQELCEKGIVHQDLWMGNIIISGVEEGLNKELDYSLAKYVFVDVGDCAKMADNSYTASVGGLLIAGMGIILGTILQNDPQPFTPEVLWKGLPLPWWIHTHWEATSVTVPIKLTSCCEKVVDFLLSAASDTVVTRIGLLTHSERFLGIRHPITNNLTNKYLKLPERYKSVKRAALDCGLLTQNTLELSIKSVRGMGIWTLLRHELGREVCNDIRSCVTRKFTPVAFDNYCGGVGGGGGIHPYGVITMSCHAYSPTNRKTTCNVGDPTIANFVTIEQMTNCGEFPQDITTVIQRWSAVYGFEFQSLDDIGD